MRMRNAKKVVLTMALFFLLHLILTGAIAYGAEYENPDTGYQVVIDDGADLLTEQEEESLIEVMKPITAYGSTAFVSVDENARSTASFARNYYYDLFGSGSGTIFVIDMDNRNIYIFSNGAVYRTITDTKADTITDNTYRYASKADYYGCAAEAYRQIFSLLEGGRIAEPMKYVSNALLALILAFIINFAIVNRASRLRRAGVDAILKSAETSFANTEPEVTFLHETKRYDPVQHSSGGGGSSGGGSSGGGGGGGGGGGHRF